VTSDHKHISKCKEQRFFLQWKYSFLLPEWKEQVQDDSLRSVLMLQDQSCRTSSNADKNEKELEKKKESKLISVLTSSD